MCEDPVFSSFLYLVELVSFEEVDLFAIRGAAYRLSGILGPFDLLSQVFLQDLGSCFSKVVIIRLVFSLGFLGFFLGGYVSFGFIL